MPESIAFFSRTEICTSREPWSCLAAVTPDARRCPRHRYRWLLTLQRGPWWTPHRAATPYAGAIALAKSIVGVPAGLSRTPSGFALVTLGAASGASCALFSTGTVAVAASLCMTLDRWVTPKTSLRRNRRPLPPAQSCVHGRCCHSISDKTCSALLVPQRTARSRSPSGRLGAVVCASFNMVLLS